jgi:hypothetical protein
LALLQHLFEPWFIKIGGGGDIGQNVHQFAGNTANFGGYFEDFATGPRAPQYWIRTSVIWEP